jgi:alpha-tubulin suppressor-like RCC1 family protein
MSSTQVKRVVFLKDNGTLWTCGDNSYEQLGVGDAISSTSIILTPTQVGTGTNWTKVSTGLAHTIAMKNDGSLWAWGNNGFGQLGLGDTISRTVPTRVGSDTDWVKVDCSGAGHTLAIKSDGTLWAWGWNNYAQLGIVNDRTQRNLPTRIGTDADWKDISAGCEGSSLGLKTDGSIWAWGYNVRLGVNTSDTFIPPTKIGTDLDWEKIDNANQQRFAIKTDGTLWAWGADTNGQLGLGGGGLYESPTKVGTDTDWAMVQTDEYQTFAIKTGGTLWACGANYSGYELGLGYATTPTDLGVVTLTKVGTDTNWQTITTWGEYTLGKKNDGTFWAWGHNDYGQLGLGDTINRNIPTKVGQ